MFTYQSMAFRPWLLKVGPFGPVDSPGLRPDRCCGAGAPLRAGYCLGRQVSALWALCIDARGEVHRGLTAPGYRKLRPIRAGGASFRECTRSGAVVRGCLFRDCLGEDQ